MTTTKLTADTITEQQIHDLKAEAWEAGDTKQADLCRLALGMTPLISWNFTPYEARGLCADAINNARAQEG